MKNMYKLALLAALGLVSITSAQAQYNDGDLTIGFTTSSTDYVVDLGQIPTTANTQLGGSTVLSGLTSAYTGVGVIGGNASGDALGNLDVWTTTLRTGTAATSYTSAGTESAPASVVRATVDNNASVPGALSYGTTSASLSTSWSTLIDQSPTQAGSATTSWATSFGNPSSATGSLTLDLWTASDANTGANKFTYVGDLQINTATDSVVFDPVSAVPEPSTYGLLSGAGMLLLGLRRQFSRKA